MADTSSSLSLPFIQPNQAQKHVTHNEALLVLDALTQLAVVADDVNTPPLAPADGVRFIVGDGGTGDWAGRDGEVAVFETSGWRYFIPRAGWRAYVIDREIMVVHDGSEWIDQEDAEIQEIEAFGLGMIAPAQTPFSAKLNAALWTALYQADGGDGALVTTLNKETTSNDAGFVFQQDFQTRAILGLFGSDDLRLTTSPDGVTFFDGLRVNNTNGIIDQPSLPRFKGVTNFDNYTAADVWTRIGINAAEFNDQNAFDASNNVFTAPADGTYHFGASLRFKENTVSSVQMSGRFFLNGIDEVTASRGQITGPHVSEETTLQIQNMVLLSAGDTVELQGRIAGSDGYFMADETCFWGYKVG